MNFTQGTMSGNGQLLIAIIIACTGLVRILVIFAIIVFGIWLGNYVQKNKEKVKEKLKNLIDKF